MEYKTEMKEGEYKMSGKVSEETIEYVRSLAHLWLSEEEKVKAKEDMEKMLDYIDLLNELDTEGAEPMVHAFSGHNVFREDIVENENGRETVLMNAPQVKDGCFEVPKTVN